MEDEQITLFHLNYGKIYICGKSLKLHRLVITPFFTLTTNENLKKNQIPLPK